MGAMNTRVRRWRLATGIIAIICWVLLSLIITVQLTVLRPAWYISAMDDANAYDRVYTQALADPAVDNIAGEMLGGWPVDPTLITGNLRTIMPPQSLRGTVEGLLDGLTTYLEGETGSIDTRVALAPLWKSIERILDSNVANAIASTPAFQSADAAEFTANFKTFVTQIASGVKPSFLPTIPLDNATSDSVVQTVLGPMDAATRAEFEPQLRVLLSEGDLNGALELVGGWYAKPLVDSAILRLKDRAGGDTLDVSVPLEAMQKEPAVRAAHTVRSIWNDGLVPLAVVLALLGIACFVTSALLARREEHGWFRWEIRVLLIAGAASMAAWVLVRLLAGDPFDSLWANPRVPPGAAGIIRDVGANMMRTADRNAAGVALSPALVGLVILATVLVIRLVPEARRHSRLTLGAIGLVATVIGVVLFIWLWPNSIKVRGEVCNGRADLCDMRVNEVVFPGSHNSEAAADSNFLGPNQDWTMPHQMDAGVRALLLKSTYWETPASISGFLDSLPPKTANTVRGLVDTALPAKPGAWMCHNLCVLGSTPLEQGFRWIREFVDAHPDEVLVVIIGDTISVDDTMAAADAANLTERIYTPDDDPAAPWPTLEQLILAHHNVIVFSEHNDAPGTWYRNYFRYGMETPYDYRSTSEFSCAPNRGDTGKQLFLMNNWVTRAMASREDAGPANDPVAVEKRAKACADERGQMVNIVAANFVDIPDIFTAVDGLNNLASLEHAKGGEPSG
jgi:hypothetical protein